MRPSAPSLLSALVLLASVSQAEVINVPGDFADLQAAIDAAGPRDVVKATGTFPGPIFIDEDITLIGPRIEVQDVQGWLSPRLVINADATLIEVSVAGGSIPGDIIGFVADSVVANGNVQMFDCGFGIPQWTNVTGYAPPSVNIRSTGELTLWWCVVGPGARPQNDTCIGFSPEPAQPAIVGDVVLMKGCDVIGAQPADVCPAPGADDFCSQMTDGESGDCVVCTTFHDYGQNVLSIGPGLTWQSNLEGECLFGFGAEVVTQDYILHQNDAFLDVYGGITGVIGYVRVPIGGSYMMDSTADGLGFLYVSTSRGPITHYPPHGYGILPTSEAVVIGPLLSPFSISPFVPTSPVLAGYDITIQLFDLDEGLSAPVWVFLE